MNRRVRKGLILLCCICILAVLGFLAFGFVDSYTTIVYINWNIKLPYVGSREIYHKNEHSYIDGIRYHVIEYSQDDISKMAYSSIDKLDKMFADTTELSSEQVDYIEQQLEYIETNKLFLPEWSKCTFIKSVREDGSELLLLYQRENRTVYVVELFR